MSGTETPWIPMSNPVDVKHLLKLAEELGECSQVVARCLIQGMDEKEPVTGKNNKVWLEEEIADVLANSYLVISHFQLSLIDINNRIEVKERILKDWHRM